MKLPRRGMKAIANGTLNWFEEGQIVMGSKNNPEHVKRWKEAWEKFDGEEELEDKGKETFSYENKHGNTGKNWKHELKDIQAELRKLDEEKEKKGK